MKKFTFQDVVDCEVIRECGDIVILAGNHPWVFRKDGTFIARIKRVCRSWNMLFLPNNMVFMDGLGDKSYHYISLTTGQLLWSMPKKGKRNLTPRTMILSPSGREVYYIYSIKEQNYIDIIIPEEQSCITQHLPLAGRGIVSAFCDHKGNVVTLKLDRNKKCMDGYCMYRLDSFSPTDLQQFCPIWSGPIAASRSPVMASNTHILFNDLSVKNIIDETEFSLLVDSDQRIRKDMFTISGYDETRRLLNIRYLGTGSTLIIDCQKRKIAAHYRPITVGYSSGCLIGDEFWVGSSDGIIKRPFPHMDPFPRGFFESP